MAGWQDAPVIGPAQPSFLPGQDAASLAATAPSAWQSAPLAAGPTPQQLGWKPGQPPTPEQLAAFRAHASDPLTAEQRARNPDMALPADNMPAPLRAFTTNAVESVPILGGLAHNARNAMADPGGGAIMDAQDIAAGKAAPLAAGAGQVFGNVAPFLVGGEIPMVAKALGAAETVVPGAPVVAKTLGSAAAALAARSGLSGTTMAGVNAADTATRGGSLTDILESAGVGFAGGFLAPGAGDLIGAAAGQIGKVGSKIGSMLHGAADPAGAGQTLMGNAARADIAAGHVLTPADEAIAAVNGQPLINADRFGPNIQSLARTAANVDPTALAALRDTTQNRFLTQSDRGVQFINRMVGGNSDALGAQSSVEAAGRSANKPAYLKAYAQPAAQTIMTPEIGQLMGSPIFRKAISSAVSSGATDSALHGYPPVQNPFRFNTDGSYTLVKQANGSQALPNLPFWDQVQRNLGTSAKMAGRAGNDYKAGQSWQLRSQLNDILDTAVPAFQRARQGAASAFGAEDALEAGRNFVNAPSDQIPSLIAAHAKFSPAEKRLFATGFASNLISKVGQAGDRTNVINNVFGSPNARAQIATAFSPYSPRIADHLEHFMRIEDTMQGTKQAIQGGSNTAAQLAAMGALGGAAGGVMSGGINPMNWNWRDVGSGAGLMMAGRYGAKALGTAIDQKVMQSVATALSSRDPALIDQVIRNAARSPKSAAAIKAIQHGMQTIGQIGSTVGTRAAIPPPPPDPNSPAMLP